MICVIGAGGTVGSELTKQLESENARFRAAYFSKEKAEVSRARGIDAVKGYQVKQVRNILVQYRLGESHVD